MAMPMLWMTIWLLRVLQFCESPIRLRFIGDGPEIQALVQQAIHLKFSVICESCYKSSTPALMA